MAVTFVTRLMFFNPVTNATGNRMTQERKTRKQTPGSIDPDRLPAELHYIAADILRVSPNAAELLRSAARQVEVDLRARQAGNYLRNPEAPKRSAPLLRLVR
jgi:hypothetical protein